MRRSKVLGLAFVAMLSLTSAAAATASAETLPNVLPLPGASAITYTSSSGESVFGTKGITGVTSGSSTGTSESTGKEGNAGTFKTTFATVKQALLGTCTGAGQTSGNVLVKGTYKDVDADLTSKLIVAVLLLLSPQVEFTCGSTAVAVSGCVAGQLTPLNTKTTLLTLTLATNGGSPEDNVITSYLNSSGTSENCLLLAKVGAGSTELSAQKTTQTLTKFEEGGKALTSVEVMEL